MIRSLTTVAFAGLALVIALVLSAASAKESTANHSISLARWDDWPCNSLQTDWNYLFHPDRINQYHLPGNTIDNEGNDTGWRKYLGDKG